MSQIARKDLLRLQDCTCHNLRKSARAVTMLYDRALKPSGLRGTQFSLLAAAAIADSVTLSNLADALVMERTTLTRNLRPLQKSGYVRLTRGDDRRTQLVSLTASGHEKLASAMPLWQQAQRVVQQGLGKQSLQQLLKELERAVTIARGA